MIHLLMFLAVYCNALNCFKGFRDDLDSTDICGVGTSIGT